MAIELEQIIKFLKIIKIREATGKILSNEVKRECEVKKIEEGLQFLNYKENEDFCCESEIIIKKNDMLMITDIGERILQNIESREKVRRLIIENCLIKNKFSNRIMPGLAQFHKDKDNVMWYEKKSVSKLFESTETLVFLNEIGLLKKEGSRIKLNPIYAKNEAILQYRKAKRKISQKKLEENLAKEAEIKKKVGSIAEKIVVNFEKIRLRDEEQCLEESNSVEQISQDWANKGYDIESFDSKSENLIPDRFIEVKGSTGKNFSIFWSQNEIEVAKELGTRYWIYFISEIDLEQETTPNPPEMIQNPFYEIDPFGKDSSNARFIKKPESIHVTKKQEN